MMLSRVADSLYWMARYLERAEHVARLLAVTLDLRLERTEAAHQQAVKNLFDSLQLPLPTHTKQDKKIAYRLVFDPEANGTVISLISAARENARQVREQISSEMWEQINRLYLELKTTNINKMWAAQPHEFFQMVKDGCHLFRGITDSTMTHGEGWYFIQFGQYLERAINSAHLLEVHFEQAAPQILNDEFESHSDQYFEWVGLLRFCTAWEAYCKVYTADPKFTEIAEFLMLNETFPHSIHFAVDMMRLAINGIVAETDTSKNSVVIRRIGRLKALLDYEQIDEILADDLSAYLYKIQDHCLQIHTAVYQTFINYPITDKLTA